MTPSPALDLRISDDSDKAALLRMFAEHTRILNSFDSSVEAGRALEEDWWKRPKDLFAFVIYSEGEPVGFVLAMGKVYVEAIGEVGDFRVWELFVEEPHRGTGLAEAAVCEVFRRFPGEWSTVTKHANARALGFWRRVLATQPGGVREGVDEDGMATFHFRSA